MSVFFWKCSARIKLVHRALVFLVFFLARGFSIIFSYVSWWFWKMVYIFCFAFFFGCNNTVIFLTHGNSVWSFPFGNLLKVVRFQTEEWHVLCTGHIRVLQTSLHRTVKSEIEILGVILRILSISLLTEDREQLMLILSVAPFLLGFLSRKLKWDC